MIDALIAMIFFWIWLFHNNDMCIMWHVPHILPTYFSWLLSVPPLIGTNLLVVIFSSIYVEKTSPNFPTYIWIWKTKDTKVPINYFAVSCTKIFPKPMSVAYNVYRRVNETEKQGLVLMVTNMSPTSHFLKSNIWK